MRGHHTEQCSRMRRSAADEELLASILAATTHSLAVDAMVSIIFSPGTERPFGALAASLAERGLPSCLVYGREDPWVVPLWGQRLKRLVPHAAYFEVGSTTLPTQAHACTASLGPAVTVSVVGTYNDRFCSVASAILHACALPLHAPGLAIDLVAQWRASLHADHAGGALRA